MREQRIAGAEVDGGDAEGREAGHIGPPELRCGLDADGSDEALRERRVEAGPGAGRKVDDLNLVCIGEEVAHQLRGLFGGAAGGEAVVHLEAAAIGDHVAGNAALDAHRVETFAVFEAVDDDALGLEPRELVEQGTGPLNRVHAHPAARGVGALAVRRDPCAECAVAAALDGAVGGLAEDREVGVEELGVVAHGSPKAAQLRRDLLVVVPDPGEVDGGLGELDGEGELHGDAGFHVDGAATPDHRLPRRGVGLVAHGQVVVDGHRVEVAGDCDTTLAAQLGARNDGVPVSGDLQMGGALAQHVLDGIGDEPFVARYRGDIAQLAGEFDGAEGRVEAGSGGGERIGIHPTQPNGSLDLMTDSRFAWSAGIATTAADGTVLDAWFPSPTLGKRPADRDRWIAPAELEELAGSDELRGVDLRPVNVEIDLDAAPASTEDAYLRLHLLSHCLVRPNSISLDGIFGKLPNVAWTTAGPMLPEVYAARLPQLKRAGITAVGLDKFPRLTDYVVPEGVRIADASRVRLGAHLAPGTTVMHEGFVNFNAGTLGASMVEGRISQGVVVGDGSDIGGGASIMGTLSGGGTQRITIGERALLGANSGIGISLGDDSVVEAGLYVTAGTKVMLPKGTAQSGGEPVEVKAVELSGLPQLLFRRNSRSGGVEALPREGAGIELNSELHA